MHEEEACTKGRRWSEGGVRGVKKASSCTGRGITTAMLQCHLELHTS